MIPCPSNGHIAPGGNQTHPASHRPQPEWTRPTPQRRPWFDRWLPLCWILPFATLLAHAQSPTVESIEPPSWWGGHTVNPVRVLVRGTQLRGPALESDSPNLRVSSLRPNEAGTAVFFDVQIRRGAPAGKYNLTLKTRTGSVPIPFEVLNPPARLGRFQGFGPDDVLYLIMPDRFADGDPSNNNPASSPGLYDPLKPRHYHGGDLEGVITKLPYLRDLGVTALWLTPWYDNNNRPNELQRFNAKNQLDPQAEPITDYHGYSAVNFYQVEEHLGSFAKLTELVDTAHEHGFKIIQDQVANHTGPVHPWVQDPPFPQWYNGTAKAHLTNNWQTWTLADPYASPQTQRDTLEGWFAGVLPDLNQDDPECSRYLIQNALWWVGMTGLDAIRQDTLPYVRRTFWSRWSKALKREYPNLTLLGEMFDSDAAKVAFFQGGRRQFDGVDSGIDSLFDFGLFYALRKTFGEGGEVRQIAEQLARDRLYPNPNMLVTFLGLHDVDRFMNLKAASESNLRLAFTTLFTLRGIPLVYYGDEIGLPGDGDPDNRRDFPGGFKHSSHDAFTGEGRTPAEAGIHAHVKRLIRIRKAFPPLRHGKLVNLVTDPQVYVYGRVSDAGRVIVAINNGSEPAEVDFSLESLGNTGKQVLHAQIGRSDFVTVIKGRLKLTLPPKSAEIWTPDASLP